MSIARLIRSLQSHGILMLSDPSLPSAVRLAAGSKIRGSWWSHPKGHEIYHLLERLEDHPDVLVTRLVSGKVTYLHRRIWPEFLSVATARENWQVNDLSRSARRLLERVDKEGEVRTDRIPRTGGLGARELERRLLAYGEEIHTDRGFHAKLLMTWSRCPKVQDTRIRLEEPEAARDVLTNLVHELNEQYHGRGKLPWEQD